ncbi:MAG: hypothetical protein ACK5TH_16540 [Prosthecobacter sp.]|jgi:hypothetical protein
MNPYLIDLLGLVLSFIWLVTSVILIRRWYLSALVAGFGSWAVLDVTGRLLARLDPQRGWHPSDSIWAATGWMVCIAAALVLLALRWIVVRLIKS